MAEKSVIRVMLSALDFVDERSAIWDDGWVQAEALVVVMGLGVCYGSQDSNAFCFLFIVQWFHSFSTRNVMLLQA